MDLPVCLVVTLLHRRPRGHEEERLVGLRVRVGARATVRVRVRLRVRVGRSSAPQALQVASHVQP